MLWRYVFFHSTNPEPLEVGTFLDQPANEEDLKCSTVETHEDSVNVVHEWVNNNFTQQ